MEVDLDDLILQGMQFPDDPVAAFEQAQREVPLLMRELPEGHQDNTALQALQALIYEDSPEAIADNFRAQGNEAFKQGAAKMRDALEFYTRAIDAKSSDAHVNMLCHLNRAAAHLELKNYGSAKRDCHVVLKMDPRNVKAHYRLCRAHHALGQLTDAMAACAAGLAIEPTNTALLGMRERIARDLEAIRQRENEMAAAQRLGQAEQAALEKAIASRKYRFVSEADQARFRPQSDGDARDDRTVASAVGHTVRLDDDGRLHWPVFFVYPEHQVSELVADFSEDDTFAEHLAVMMQERAPWDADGKYAPKKLVVSFEARKKDAATGKTVITLAQVGQATKLSDVLAHPSYHIVDRTPAFFITVANSPFHKHFIEQYKTPLTPVRGK